jgi:hypothetical protein
VSTDDWQLQVGAWHPDAYLALALRHVANDTLESLFKLATELCARD